MPFVRIVLALVLSGVWLSASPAAATPRSKPQRTVAITFDDLPFVGGPSDPKFASDANRRILAALDANRAPATAFVNEAKVRELGPSARAMLAGWNRGRYELANHSFSHADANKLSIDEIRREIVEGEATIGPMARAAGRSIRYFRFPFNHVGNTAEKKAAIEALLYEHGYRLAASTIDTSDYMFNDAYERALNVNDRAMSRRIETAYLDHSRDQIAYYAGLNSQVLGYEPPEIMLLHLNRINAAVMRPLLRLFREAGYRFVSLEQAQIDPVYAKPPAWVTAYGPMWGYRWARDRGIRVNGSLEKEPPEWIANYGAGKPAAAPAG